MELRNRIITQINEKNSCHTLATRPNSLCSRHTGSIHSKLTGLKFPHHRSGQSLSPGGGRDRDEEWRTKAPEAVAEIIKKNWSIVDKFARMEDKTTRMMGMKFPKEGYNK